MWAQQLVAPRKFTEVDVPAPDPAGLLPDELVVEVLAGGICGSDLPAFKGMRSRSVDDVGSRAANVPGFPMHEVVGRVLVSRDNTLERGAEVVGWAAGFDALAEQTVLRGSDVARFDRRLAADRAVLLQPLACALYALDQLGDVRGVHAAVLGQGPIGMLFSHVLKARGARTVVGVDDVDRRADAAAFGVDEAVHARVDRWASSLRPADRPELVVEAIGHQVSTLNDAVEATADGGRIYYFGVPDDAVYPFAMRSFFRRNLTLISGVTKQRRLMLARAQDYLARHRDLLDSYVSHVLPACEAQAAFELAAVPAPGRRKIVVTTGR